MTKTIISLAAITLLASGCGATTSDKKNTQPPVKQPPTTRTIDISNFSFQPTTMTINAGDTIIWTNRDSAVHTIKGQDFGSAPLSPNATYKLPFSKAGTYNYICSVHPEMKGEIIVK